MSAETTEKISHEFTGNRGGEDKLLRFTPFNLCVRPGLYGFVNCRTGMFFLLWSILISIPLQWYLSLGHWNSKTFSENTWNKSVLND